MFTRKLSKLIASFYTIQEDSTKDKKKCILGYFKIQAPWLIGLIGIVHTVSANYLHVSYPLKNYFD